MKIKRRNQSRGTQLHKKFVDEQVKSLLARYLNNQSMLEQVLQILGIKRSRFFKLLSAYKNNPEGFSIQYKRTTPKRIRKHLEKIIIKQLETEKKMIENKDIPIKFYNYSYIKDQILKQHQEKVSVTTIIKRAKEHNFYIPKPQRKTHDREVLTNYAGELIQHDSSYHLWSPYAENKWYLITSVDDYSRYMLYAALSEKESSWAHILALESVFLTHGVPFKYYTDNHSIFRFVQGRDSIWREHHKLTDDVVPQLSSLTTYCRT